MASPTVSRTLTAIITREGTWYVARCLQVEVTSQGPTVEDSLANLKEALELYFLDGAPVPDSVSHPLVTQIEIRTPA
jgi:predicted RNase H-like HicB family nuclease